MAVVLAGVALLPCAAQTPPGAGSLPGVPAGRISARQGRDLSPELPAVQTSAAPSAAAACVGDVLESLAKFENSGRNSARKVGFELPQAAVNEYLAYALRRTPRPGIGRVAVTLLPRNEVAATVEVDFDAVRQWDATLVPEPLGRLLAGRRTLRINLQFTASEGSLTLTVRDGHGPENTPLPRKALQELLQSIGAHQPEAYDLGRPVPLPFGLKRVWTADGLVGGET